MTLSQINNLDTGFDARDKINDAFAIIDILWGVSASGGTGSTGSVDSVNGQVGIVSLSTTDIPEGSNLYYTNSLVQSYLDTLTNSVNSVNGFTGSVSLSTTDIPEGENLYFTNSLVQTYLDTQSLFYGTGMSNYLPIFLDTNTLTSSIIYSDGSVVGFGTMTPNTLVHIESATPGAFRLVDTTEGSGKVLTSDSNGIGTWQNVGTSSGTGTVNKYSETILNASIIIGVPITVSHSLVSTDIVTSAWDLGTGELTYPKFDNRTSNSVDVTFASIPPSDIRIIIMS